jgi:uncharacterized phage-associated protein
MNLKLTAFEYVLFKLIQLYKSKMNFDNDNEFNKNNDFSKLKVIKLHFFVSAVNSKNNRLLDVFNNFYAMPYGHVESDIYCNISNLKRYIISKNSIEIKNQYINNIEESFINLNQTIREEIDNSIITLNNKNKNIIILSALDLVEISHFHFSWRYAYGIAVNNNRYSEPIQSNLIKNEIKYFSLNS